MMSHRPVILLAIAVSVVIALALSSCEMEPDIAHTGNDSTVVLLISTFRHGLDENVWDMILCQGCEAMITDDDMLLLTVPGNPSGYDVYAGMLSDREWLIGDGDTYLLTIEYEYGPYLCFDCGHAFGIRTGEAWQERMLVEIITTDHGIDMMLRNGYCYDQIAMRGYDIVESMHTLSIEFSQDNAVIRYDGDEIAGVQTDPSCGILKQAFRIYTYIGVSYGENSIKYRMIKLEKFRN